MTNVSSGQPETLCCICRSNNPLERYVFTLPGHPALDSAAVEKAYERVRKFVEKVK